MWWKFWKKNREQQDEINRLKKQLIEVDERLKKLNRFEYKKNREIQGNFKSLNQKLDRINNLEKENQRLKEKEKLKEQKIENFCLEVINLIDEIDHLLDGLGKDDKSWQNVLQHWLDLLLKMLKTNGIEEIKVRDKQFDFKKAEAVKALTAAELQQKETDHSYNYQPYQVIDVIKRGFVDQDDNLIRKAKVITYRGEDKYAAK